MTLSLTINQTLKWFSSLPIVMQKLFWGWQCSDRYIISLFPPPPYPPPFSPSLISLVVSVDVTHHVYLRTQTCEPVLPETLAVVSLVWPSGKALALLSVRKLCFMDTVFARHYL